MAHIKWVFKLFEGIAFSIWGITFVEILCLYNVREISSLGILDEVDNSIKILTVIAGFIVLIIKGYHLFVMNKLIREEKRMKNQEFKRKLDNNNIASNPELPTDK